MSEEDRKQTNKGETMKRIIETTDDSGLVGLLGEKVQVWCANYIYSGVLSGVNDTTIELSEACVVYETGPLSGAPKDAQRLPGTVWNVSIGAIESFGVQP